MKDYEFTFDSEYGVYFGMIQAPDEKTFLEEIRNNTHTIKVRMVTLTVLTLVKKNQ